MTKKIAVLMAVYNRAETTIKCIKTLYDIKLPEGFELDVYITDGGSSDGTVEMVRRCFPLVDILVDNGTFWNRGMYSSWKRAIESCSKNNIVYDYYLWLNDDTFLYDNCILELLEISRVKNNKAIVVGATVDTKTRKKHTYGGRIGKELVSLDGKINKVETFNGNIVLVPIIVYEKIGILDNYYRHSFGDIDYALRANRKGIVCFQTRYPVGECDRHDSIMKWCDPQIPLTGRWNAMMRPNGYRPDEVWHFAIIHFGFFRAILSVCLSLARCIFPSLWIKLNRANWI